MSRIMHYSALRFILSLEVNIIPRLMPITEGRVVLEFPNEEK